MKKIFYLLLAPLLMMSFYSCGDDDDDDDKSSNTLKVEAYYCLPNSTYEAIDTDSKVYIFRGDFTTDQFVYKGNGEYYNKTDAGWTKKEKEFTIPESGFVNIDIDYACTIVVESNQYPDKYQIKYKPLSNTNETEKFVFTAE